MHACFAALSKIGESRFREFDRAKGRRSIVGGRKKEHERDRALRPVTPVEIVCACVYLR